MTNVGDRPPLLVHLRRHVIHQWPLVARCACLVMPRCHEDIETRRTRQHETPPRQVYNLKLILIEYRDFSLFRYAFDFQALHQVQQFNRVLLPAGSWCACVHTISSLVISIPFYVYFLNSFFCFVQAQCSGYHRVEQMNNGGWMYKCQLINR